MKRQATYESRLNRRLISLLIGVVLFFFVWLFVVEPRVTSHLETLLGRKIWEYGVPVGFMYGFGFGILPPIALGAAAYTYAYFLWILPHKTKLAQQQLQKLADAREAMRSALVYIETFESELRHKSVEAERLRNEILSLKLVNSESAEELARKLNAISSVSRSRIWFERWFAFFAGILSSLVASWLWQLLD